MDERQRKPKRTKEEMLADIDKRIEYHLYCIERLKMQKEEMLTPKITYKDVLAGAKEKGLTPAQVAEILGITVGDK